MNDRVLITGGASGIGLAVVQRCQRDGLACVVIDRHSMPAGVSADFIQADLGDEAQARAAFAQAARRWQPTRLVNNVGTVRLAAIAQVSLSDIEASMRLNVGTSVLALQALLPAMTEAGFGRVVNISSRAALGKKLRTSYSASKSAIHGLTRTWALELAASGITVNAVGPGPIATPLFTETNAPDDPMTRQIVSAIPVARMGRPEDIAGAVAYFLGADSGFVTGQVLYVCGGMTVGLAS